MSIVSLIEEKINAVTDSEVLCLTDLVKAGLYNHLSSAKSLLKCAQIPSIKLGGKVVFARKDLIDFLCKSSTSDLKMSQRSDLNKELNVF